MAFQDVNQFSGKAMNPKNDLEVGQTIEGYVTGFGEGKHGPIINMRIGDEAVAVFTTGNLRYLVKDGKIKTGLLTRITRTPDEKIKGMNSSQFSVLQDPDKELSEKLFSEIGEQVSAEQAPAKAPATTVKQRAQELAKQVAGNGKR